MYSPQFCRPYFFFCFFFPHLHNRYTSTRCIFIFLVFSIVCVLLRLSLLLEVSYEELYAFSYNPKQNDQQREEGWQLIDLGAEFERMGVPCDQWQLTDVNRDYKVDI